MEVDFALPFVGSDSAAETVPHAEAKEAIQDKEKDVVYINIGQLVESMKAGMKKSEAAQMDAYLSQAGGVEDAYLLIQTNGTEDGISGIIKLHLGE